MMTTNRIVRASSKQISLDLFSITLNGVVGSISTIQTTSVSTTPSHLTKAILSIDNGNFVIVKYKVTSSSVIEKYDVYSSAKLNTLSVAGNTAFV